MNLTTLRKHPAAAAAAAGLLGLMLRAALYRIGFDEKGILSAAHPLHLACVILAAGTTVCLAIQAAKSDFSAVSSRVRFPLGLAAGCLLLLQGWMLFRQIAPNLPQTIAQLRTAALPLVRCILTIAAGLAMAAGTLPGSGTSRAANCHGLICLCCGIDMLSRYRDWSGNPQLPDYCFHVLASVALTLAAYQTLALHTGLGSRKLQRFFSLWALFLCLMCLIGPEPRAFYLGGCLWAMVCLTTAVSQEEASDDPA